MTDTEEKVPTLQDIFGKPVVVVHMLPEDEEFARLYELARRIGDGRFGRECQHLEKKNGRCTSCGRRVR